MESIVDKTQFSKAIYAHPASRQDISAQEPEVTTKNTVTDHELTVLTYWLCRGAVKHIRLLVFISTSPLPLPIQSLPHTRIHVEVEDCLGSHSLQSFLPLWLYQQSQLRRTDTSNYFRQEVRKLHDQPGSGCLHQARIRPVFCCITPTCFIPEGCHNFEIIAKKVENYSPVIIFTSRGQYQRIVQNTSHQDA